MRLVALSVALFAATAWAKVDEANLPLRVVARIAGRRVSNCIFASAPIPPHARASTVLASSFAAGQPMFARCYLPDRPGANRAGELVDVFYLDGKPWWEQAYDDAVPPDALERPIVLGEVLRTPLQQVAPGVHRLQIVGTLRRAGRASGSAVVLYRGEVRYVR